MSEKQGREKIGRTNRGQFAPGVSGNPAGRPRSSTNELLARARDAAQEILPMMLDKAREGDMYAQKVILELGIPKTKPMAEKMSVIPGFPYEGEPREQQAFIMGCMAGGLVSVEEAKLYFEAISNTHKLPTGQLDFSMDCTNPLPDNLRAALLSALASRGIVDASQGGEA